MTEIQLSLTDTQVEWLRTRLQRMVDDFNSVHSVHLTKRESSDLMQANILISQFSQALATV